MLFIGPHCVRDLLAIRWKNPGPGTSVFRLLESQIGQKVQEAGKAAGLGERVSGHSGRIGMARDKSAAGVELPALMTADRWCSLTMPARYTPQIGRRQESGYQVPRPARGRRLENGPAGQLPGVEQLQWSRQ